MQKRIIFLLLFMFATSAYADKMLELRKEANEGNAEAQFELGLMYENGRVVKRDFEKAVEWYTKSAEQGHQIAKIVLSEL